MRPLRLEIQAFGAFANRQVVDFSRLRENPLFLINGVTGAGKTTILDAICYALYGVTSGADRDILRLRSDHAPPGLLSEVSFDAVEEEIASAAAASGDEDAELTAVDLLFHVQRLGALGATAGTREDRSALYGDFLSRCAECHVLTGGGPAL